MSHVRAAPPVDKIDSHSLTQVREYLDGEVRAAGRDEGGEEVPPAEADHQAGAEVGDLQEKRLFNPSLLDLETKTFLA